MSLREFFAALYLWHPDWERRIGALLAFLASIVVVFWLAGCQSLPQPPKVVTKVVTEYRDLPAWATEQVPNNSPTAQTVRSITESNNRRGETLDYVNCRSRLIERLAKGEPVNALECVK